MKTRISAGLAALIVAMAGFAAIAEAATSTGKISSFSYNTAKKSGKLAVKKGSHKVIYRVPAKANCGVSFGQSGDQIPCKSLGKAKYDGKPVNISWKANSKGERVASLVSVDLSK
jgi:hypothetical protein